MEEAAGEQSSRNVVGWGIYDRLKKVPRLSSSKDVVSPRGRRNMMVDTVETPSETAARRMVEDLFKQEADAAEPLGDFVLIDGNEVSHKGQKKQEEAEITVCECVIEDGNPDSACGDQCLNMMTCTECTPGHCPSQELCRNQRFQRHEYAQTKLVKTENCGWGLATSQDLKAGDFVMEYCGEVITQREAHGRAKLYESAGSKDCYIIDLNGVESIDATHSGNFARFINHSCDPNCETTKWTVLGEDRIGIFAIKDIDAGTELTYDYKYQWYGGTRVRCACGTSACGGFFGAKTKAFQKDAYVWEDDMQRKEEEDSQQSDAEDDAPLSSFIDPLLAGRKAKIGGILTAKSGVVVPKTPTEKSSTFSGSEIPVKKETETHISTETETQIQTTADASPSYALAEKSTPVRRRGPVFKRDKLSNVKGGQFFGKFKESGEPKAKKLVKAQPKESIVDEEVLEHQEETNNIKKRVKSVSGDQTKGLVMSLEQLLSQNASRVARFQQARIVVNKQLFAEGSPCFPVSEAACSEVEFNQELQLAAGSDLRKVCEEIQPAVKEHYSRDMSFQESTQLPTYVGQNWMEARCKLLRSSLDFHFSIIRHLAGPTFAMCSTKDPPS